MQITLSVAVFLCLSGNVVWAETGRSFATTDFFPLCAAQTVEAAKPLGDSLGWRRLTEAEEGSWKRAMEADAGVTAEWIGWRRGEEENADAVVFWTVSGADRHYHVCAYTTRAATDLSDAIRRRHGAPGTVYDAGSLHTATWTEERSEISEIYAGGTTMFEIVTDD